MPNLLYEEYFFDGCTCQESGCIICMYIMLELGELSVSLKKPKMWQK